MTWCKIADFIFEAKELESEERAHDFSYATINRVDNHPLYQDVGKDSETITLKGYYIRQKMDKLENLINIAKQKCPVRYTTVKYSFNVIIVSIKRVRKVMIKDVGVKEEFIITLKRIYE